MPFGHSAGRCIPAIILCLGILQAALVQGGPLMAVDLGGEFLKVSVVKPGRTPISIVSNEMSKRRTSAQLAFIEGDRLLGEEAAALAVRYPDRVYARTRDLVGKLALHDDVSKLLTQNLLPYTIVEDPDRKTVGIKTQKGDVVSAEALVGGILHYAKQITSAASDGAQVLDCVIVVPPFFGPAQRQALYDAAHLAGLNVLALINSHAAAALQYGIERDFSNKTEWVILYDMGATSTEAALVKYSSFVVKEFGKPKTFSQFEVKDVAWDASLGAEKLDLILLNHFADEFQEKHSVDIRSFPKAVAKLKRQAKKTKEVLSANTEAPISVEELHNGIDFRSRITRADFEGLAGDFFASAAKPLSAVLARNGLLKGGSGVDVTAVELLGGGSRVPAVQAALSKALGGRTLDKHLDADEAVVLGAGLFAANLSTTFRLRKFGMTDGATFPLMFQLERTDEQDFEAEAYQPKALLPFMKRVPAKRVVHLPEAARDPVEFSLSFNESLPLPQGISSTQLANYHVTGIDDAKAKHSETPKLSVHFAVHASGLLQVTKGEAVFETTEEYTVKVAKPKPKADKADKGKEAPKEAEKPADPASDEDADDAEPQDEETEDSKVADAKAGAAANETAEPAIEYEEMTKTRKKTVRLPLTVAGPGLVMPSMTAEQLKEGKKLMSEFERREAEKRDAERSKNDLEAYIISTGGILEDGAYDEVTTEKQREAFKKELAQAEDWLYEDGAAQSGPVFRKKLAALKQIGDPMSFRAAESASRPKAVEGARQLLELIGKSANAWPTIKPWLNETDIKGLTDQVAAYEKWLAGEVTKQGKLKPDQDPVLKSADVDAKLEDIRKVFNKLKNKKKPKPPPPPPSAANDTSNTTEPEETIEAEYVEVSIEEEIRIEEGSGEMPAKDEL
ncbi:g13152 [Coccomyxa viridis]|uniref:G13152 protein n=1 Tax=Coccomyxa viridis TaxID=1274662 RepID=A0ABP1GCF7_9CHLO